MLVLTQLVYVVPGQEAVFEAFEEVALTAVARYGGRILLRSRPGPGATLAGAVEPPYEIHLIEFPDEEAFARFAADGERQRALHLRTASVRATLLYRGDSA